MYLAATALWFGLAAGNFIWQGFFVEKEERDWARALDRSIYQFVALAAFVAINASRYVTQH